MPHCTTKQLAGMHWETYAEIGEWASRAKSESERRFYRRWQNEEATQAKKLERQLKAA